MDVIAPFTDHFRVWAELMSGRFEIAGYTVQISGQPLPLNPITVLDLESADYIARITGHEHRSTFDFHIIDVTTEADVMNVHTEGSAQYKPAFGRFFGKLHVPLDEPIPTFGALAVNAPGLHGKHAGGSN